DVHPERGQKIQRVTRRHRALGERLPEIDGFLLAISLADKLRLEHIQIGQLFVRTKRWMVGDVVGSPDEIIERQDQGSVAWMNDPRGHREILVAVALAGSKFARGGHRKLAVSGQFGVGLGVPHIGEYVAKTNAVSRSPPVPNRLRAFTARDS